MCVGGEKYRAGPCFHRALLPEQPSESCWWLWYMWRVVWWESWQRGGEGRGTRGERCCRNGRSHCSGELISSRGPLFILEGSMEPHCPWGFCSRWFFSIDFSPSALKTHVGIMKNLQVACAHHLSNDFKVIFRPPFGLNTWVWIHICFSNCLG